MNTCRISTIYNYDICGGEKIIIEILWVDFVSCFAAGLGQIYAMPVFDMLETVLVRKWLLPPSSKLRLITRTTYVGKIFNMTKHLGGPAYIFKSEKLTIEGIPIVRSLGWWDGSWLEHCILEMLPLCPSTMHFAHGTAWGAESYHKPKHMQITRYLRRRDLTPTSYEREHYGSYKFAFL